MNQAWRSADWQGWSAAAPRAIRSMAVSALGSMLIVVALLSGGCAGGGGATPGGKLSPGDLQALIAAHGGNLSPFQAAILDDGRITFAEYEAAVLENIRCLREAGLSVIGGLDADGKPLDDAPFFQKPYNTYYVLVGVPEGRTGAARTDCAEQYLSVVAQAWVMVAPPDRKAIEEIWEFTAMCMRSGGLDIPPDATHSQIDAIGQGTGVYGMCRAQAEERFQFRDWVMLD